MILLTGVNGQVGSHLARRLKQFGAFQTVDVAPVEGLPRPDHLVDFKDEQALRALVRELKPKVVINTAAYTAVDKAETDADTARLVNALAPGILAEECKTLKALLVHYSTDYVFPGEGTKPYVETDPTGPLSAYGKTKLEGEQLIARAGAAFVNFRTCWVVSSHGANFVKTMLRLGAEKDEIKVVADQFGAPTSARVLADATTKAVQQGMAQGFEAVHGTYHVACKGETTWHGFATEIHRQARAAGLPIKTKTIHAIPTSDYPTPARRPKNSRFDCRKFEKTFGMPLPPWQDELAQIIRELAGTSRPA